MERDDRAAVASFYCPVAFAIGARVPLEESAVHHARVKRLNVRDRVRLSDGEGRVAWGPIAALDRRAVEVEIDAVGDVTPPTPIHLRVPIGDRDRLLWLAEKATELGVATWQAVRFRRSASVSPRGEGPAFAAKLQARMIGALEQSGGAWLPRLLPDVAVEDVAVNPTETPILLDVAGEPLAHVLASSGGRPPVLLFGPEGGLEPDERSRLVNAGWRTARVATATLRFETAGIVAAGVCRNLSMIAES